MDSESKIKPPDDIDAHQPTQTACDSMPDFTRLRYFYGQMLAAQDLQTEQDYFREKLKLHNRCLHGYGTVCGLKVVAIKPPHAYELPAKGAGYQMPVYDPSRQDDAALVAAPQQQGGEGERRADGHTRVEIECGMAIDCEGNELIVRHPLQVDLWPALSDVERKEIENAGRAQLYVSICYCVQAIDPVRPVLPDACDAVSECVYSKLRDSVKIKVTTKKPNPDHCRDNCCDKCGDKCLLLAAIDFEKGRPLVIHNDVRRWIAVYKPVTITGISWVHAADNYSPEEAGRMLEEQGLTIEFSRPILAETVTKGVVEVVIFEGGKGRHSGIYYIDGDVTVSSDRRRVVFTDPSGESLEHGDRVLVIVRTDFILDECCRSVDGNHTGGRVPLLESFAGNKPQNGTTSPVPPCVLPPRRYGAWVSGNGTPGGTFESWFYIQRPPRAPKPGGNTPQQYATSE